MSTKAEVFKNAQQRAHPAKAKQVHKATRAQRTVAAADAYTPPTRSVRGSEHAQQMKSATASSRHGRRSG